MLTRLRNVWRPERFHYHHRLAAPGGRPGCFEGWYFKIVDAHGAQPYAIIPGVFLGDDAHAFVQILDGRRGRTFYHRAPLADFSASRSALDVRIGASRFHEGGLEIDLDGEAGGARQRVSARIRFGAWERWPASPWSPGVMGPFGLLPFMECYHGILSLHHAVSGTIEVDGVHTDLDGGRGYVEKDWGRGFPAGYVWAHSNHFDQPGASLTASVANIPWLGTSFRGFLAGLRCDGRLHRFATYTGASVERCQVTDTHVHIQLADRARRLVIEAKKSGGAVLKAPYGMQMLERVAETMTSVLDVRLEDRSGRVLFAGRGQHACLEAVGNLRAITF